VLAFEVELEAYKGRLPEEFEKAFGLLSDKAFVLLIRKHYDALFALTGDELGPFGSSAAKEFAEASFGGLDLPSGGRLEAAFFCSFGQGIRSVHDWSD
jgi:hypothetical protein